MVVSNYYDVTGILWCYRYRAVLPTLGCQRRKI